MIREKLFYTEEYTRKALRFINKELIQIYSINFNISCNNYENTHI
jgi:hypothetical protein